MLKNFFLAVLLLSTPAATAHAYLPPEAAAVSPFGQAFDLNFHAAQSLAVKTAARMGFVFYGSRDNGALIFLHRRPKMELLDEALAMSEVNTEGLIAGDILLIVSIHDMETYSYISANALVLGYEHKIVRDVALKVSEPSLLYILKFFSAFNAGGNAESDRADDLIHMEVEAPVDEVEERLQVLAAFRPDRVLHFDGDRGVALLEHRFDEMDQLEKYFRSEDLDGRFDYRQPRTTCIVYWRASDLNPGSTDLYLLPGLVVERQTYARRIVYADGYDSTIASTPALAVYYKNYLQSILGRWPYEAS